MMCFLHRKGYLQTLLMLSVAMLAACSDETSTSSSVIKSDPVTAEPQATLMQTVNFEYMLQADQDALHVYDDRDRDGIHDDVDVYPDTAPSFRDPTSARELSIKLAWTEMDGQSVSNTAIENQLLKVSGSGLTEAATNPDSWLVFMTESGLRAVRATLGSDGSLSALPPSGAMNVHAVIGLSRSVEVTLDYLPSSAPILYNSDAAFIAGEVMTLSGRNLGKVNQAILGTDNIELLAATENSVTLRTSQTPTSNQLRVYVEATKSNRLALDLRHQVTLSIAGELTMKSGDALALWYAGEVYRITPEQVQTVSVPAYKPVVLFFDVVSAAGTVRYYSRLSTVVWPGDEAVQVSPASTLSARLLNMGWVLPQNASDNSTAIREALAQALATPSAVAFVSELQQLLVNGISFQQELRISEVVAEYRNSINPTPITRTTTLLAKTSPPVAAKLTTTGGELDDVLGATVTYAGEGPDADEPNGGDYVYPRQTLGNDYAQFVIVPHQDIRIVNRNLSLFNSTCNFSADEQLKKPAILWDSDLCVQLDGLVFASVAVFKPGMLGIDESYQPVAGSADQVRRHARTKFNDVEYLWGKGGYYLKDDKGRALCNMETCYVEIITSGYGAGYKVVLTDAQQALVDTLRVRMWAEMLNPVLLNIAGVSDDRAKVCLFNEMLKDGNLYDQMALLNNKIQTNANKTGNELVLAVVDAVDETVGQWALDFVKGQVNTAFFNCVKTFMNPQSQVANVFNEKISSALKDRVGGLFKFAEILATVSDLGSAVLTPEKIVFRMDSRARIVGIEPRLIDVYEAEGNNLDLLGPWIAEAGCTASGWCPQLIFRDAYGKEYAYQIVESNIVPSPLSLGLAYRQISIPLTDLQFGLQGLSSGPVEMKLAISDIGKYDSYIDPKFGPDSYRKLPLPVANGVMQLQTRARVFAFDPPLAQPGETVKLLGYRLSVYGDAPIFELSYLDNNLFPPIPLQRSAISLNPDEEVELKLPAIASGQYRVTIKPDPALGDTNLSPLVSESPLLISSGAELPAVIVGDLSSNKDNNLLIELLDADGNPVSDASGALRFVIPTELREPKGRFTDGIYWDDSFESDLSDYVKKIKVTCVNAGNDTCSYGIRMLRDRLCGDGWPEPLSFYYAAKMLEGQVHIYDVKVEGEGCPLVIF